MNFHPFVIPFSIGFIVLIFILLYKYFSLFYRLDHQDKSKIYKGVFSLKFFKAIKEVFLESLLHRKIFRVNPLLGYMHTSLAFGWFLIIIGGTVESKVHSHMALKMPYDPVFFNFFNTDLSMYRWANEFNFIMDFLLLIVLSGVCLAFVKRFYSKAFGMKKTSVLKPFDKIALYTLWLIFPLRFFAESFSAGLYNNGGFLTGTAGVFFSSFLPLKNLLVPTWWAYSISLGAFFVALPFSRYMHIPTEIFLIFLRNFGVKTDKIFSSFTELEVLSCPRCGICLDKCQLLKSAEISDTQNVYFLQSLRNKQLNENNTFDCLLCGRCQEFCPVGINLNNIRISQRKHFFPENNNFEYLQPIAIATPKASVIYFAGCMTHLTPTIKLAMTGIFEAAGVDYLFLDKDSSICCGRPLMIAGEYTKANELIEKNKKAIIESGAKTLVTSCPICYKMFNEDYDLNIEVLHHTQYLLQLTEKQIIKINKTNKKVVYHDPCELGRGSGIFNEPRELISHLADISKIKEEKEEALCCGGSLGSVNLSFNKRNNIRKDVLSVLQEGNPDLIITACPLCKKTLQNGANTEVKDIAELVMQNIQNQ
ncbi:MAG: (Fe-S)-binding protein [Bacteroidetes bacterium]|nr:(Fe-S)-binding protein [Bacteroidota bacterium]